MLNEELYETLEQEFEKNKIEDAVEDILLELAELLADQETTGEKTDLPVQSWKSKAVRLWTMRGRWQRIYRNLARE